MIKQRNYERLAAESLPQVELLNITGLPKHELLAALYNDARPMGLHKPTKRCHITSARACEILRSHAGLRFAHLEGRELYISLEDNFCDPSDYDGTDRGKAKKIIERLREHHPLLEIEPQPNRRTWRSFLRRMKLTHHPVG